MSMEWAQSLLDSIAHVSVWNAALLFMAFGAVQIIIPIFPGDILLLLGAGLWVGSAGVVQALPILLLYWLGVSCASCLAYELGRHFGVHIFRWRWVQRFLPESAQHAVTQWLSSKGTPAIFLAKFITGVNVPMLILCGAMGCPRNRAYPPILAATTVQNVLLFGIGALLGDRLSSFAAYSGKVQLAFALLIVLIIAVAVAVPRLLARRLQNTKK